MLVCSSIYSDKSTGNEGRGAATSNMCVVVCPAVFDIAGKTLVGHLVCSAGWRWLCWIGAACSCWLDSKLRPLLITFTLHHTA